MYNISYIDDISFPDAIDNNISDLKTNNATPFNSIPSNNLIPSIEVNHVQIINSSNFPINFNIIYTIGEKNYSSNSREFSPSFTRQISFPINAKFLYLIINSINSSNKENPIYHMSLNSNKNFTFNVTGTIDNPIITEQF
ncbi:hypothetical protein [Clostridium tarantellae]|uniref:Uncharacterized protein n=1 Tax=Clostridium tarantellae TaxID=39493 RepID=A0A6I1MXU5_9CLOT|nr:hypothetical protein [Clostridium tarantellae]MPQ44969.1 hypothetical protein [Clostridium tarantellae]